jgi:hypothetical protein
MGKKKPNPAQQVINSAQTAYEGNKPSALENQLSANSGEDRSNYTGAVEQNKADYGNIMGGYNAFRTGLNTPGEHANIKAGRPAELGESFGYLREAMPGYRDFAKTGGYSPTDVQELRARGTAPIRAAYGSAMRGLDRSRALGGAGGSPNYIAALSKANREQPGALADATTNVNAGLADSIRQGKQFGLGGITQTGATMGGLASDDASRQLQASMSNQNYELQNRGMQLQALQGQTGLYGTTPGLSNMFGDQALQGNQLALAAQKQRQDYGLGLLGAQLGGYSANKGAQGTPWWQTALKYGAVAAPYVAAPFTGGASLMATPYTNSLLSK